mmetsp:Transcript_8045/g.12950  ORF Transcript_8045/g.12950 Transcript_8045/m.12950 type:complete len:87 (-) Transcript_8045:85-345(-)
MGVSRSDEISPIPSPPKASLTPSKRPMFKAIDVLEVAGGAGTKACAHEVVAATTRSDDFMFICGLIVNCYERIEGRCVGQGGTRWM